MYGGLDLRLLELFVLRRIHRILLDGKIQQLLTCHLTVEHDLLGFAAELAEDLANELLLTRLLQALLPVSLRLLDLFNDAPVQLRDHAVQR